MAHTVLILLAVLSTFAFSQGLQTCIPGSKLQEKCNECTCTAGRWSCTEKPCPNPTANKCIEGKTWREGCKECVCSKGTAICTPGKSCHKSRTTRSLSCLFHTGEYFRDPNPGSCYICRCTSDTTALCDDYDMKCGFNKVVNKIKSKFRSWFN